MRVLAIETATIVCAVAVIDTGHVRGEVSRADRNAHAEHIMGLVDGVLSQARLTLGDIDGIAVSVGPGSFTGLRIGLSVAKGLAYAAEKPLVAVPTLLALAERTSIAGLVPEGAIVLSSLDARRNEVYCQLFRRKGTELRTEWEVCSLAVSDLLSRLGDEPVVLTGDGSAKIVAGARDASPAKARTLHLVSPAVASCSAATVALVGERLLHGGVFADPRTLEPRYVKEFSSKATVTL